MLDDFLVRAGLAATGAAAGAGPLGCFIIWRRMVYFGDATAHAAILGVALSIGFSAPLFAGVLIVAVAMALTVHALSERGQGMDTLLAVLSHSALAAGLVAVSFLAGVRVDISAFLFGDILTVGKIDLLVIWGGAVAVLALLTWRWNALITATLSPDLAVAAGIDPRREQIVLTLSLAVVVAVAIKVIGALLIVAMLIIPAAAARPLSRTPEAMAVLSAVIGVGAAMSGLLASFQFDTPTGPSIVVAAGLLFALSHLVAGARKTHSSAR